MKSVSSISIRNSQHDKHAAPAPILSSSSAHLLTSASASNILENRDNLLQNKRASSRHPKIPDLTSIRSELLSAVKGGQADPVYSGGGGDPAIRSHVRFDHIQENAVERGFDEGEDEDGADAGSAYSSDETSDLLSEARSYAEMDDERAETMRALFAEARYHRDGHINLNSNLYISSSGGSGAPTNKFVNKPASSFREAEYFGAEINNEGWGVVYMP